MSRSKAAEGIGEGDAVAAFFGTAIAKVVGVVERDGGVGRDVLGQHQGLYEVGGRGGYRARVRTFYI